MQTIPPTWVEIVEAAGWSQSFIDFRPARLARDQRQLRRAARAFLERHPNSPFTVDWLVRQYNLSQRGVCHGYNSK